MMKKIFQWLKSNPLALLSGVLVGTSYIPFPPWAILFCYIPLWLEVFEQKNSLKEAFWSGWRTQFVLSLIGFHWIAYTAKEFGQLPWAVSVLALLLFAAFMHLYIPASVVIAKALQNRFRLSSASSFVVAALTLALLERVWPVIFQWHLGYAWLASRIPIYQWADVIGFEGLSTLTLLFNAAIGILWLSAHRPTKTSRLVAGGLTVFAVFALLTISGHYRGQNLPDPDRKIQVSLIQANIGNLEKVYAEQGRGYQASITQKFLALSQKEVFNNPSTELLVWPETAFPDYLGNEYLDRKNTRVLVDGLLPLNKSLLTGAYSKDANTSGAGDSTYNGLFLIRPNGENWSPPYRKTHLLAFGEYLPLSEQFPILLKWLPFVSNFGRGPGPMAMTMIAQTAQGPEEIHFGGQICYESLYPAFSRGLAEQKAEILINVTNDSWFGLWFEPYQHMYMTLARGVETRRPLIRSTNTGISTVILANGQILKRSPLHQEWSGTYTVSYLNNPPLTIYTQWGHWDWIFWLLLLALVFLKGAANAKSRNA